MKRVGLAVLILVSVLVSSLFHSNVCVAAEYNVVVDSESVLHNHTSQTGSCYTPVYHVHKGSSSSYGECFKTPVYHVHDGDTTNGGACFEGRKCGGISETVYGSHYVHSCLVCGYTGTYYMGCGGADADADPGDICRDAKCPNIIYSLKCGKSESTVEYYTQTCTKTTSTIDSYRLVCSKGNQSVGNIQMVKNRDTSYRLSTQVSGVTLVSQRWSTGSTGSQIDVTSNGVYTCTVTVRDFAGLTYSKTLSYTVTDYDITPPQYIGLSRESERCNFTDVQFSFSDNYGVTEYKLQKM